MAYDLSSFYTSTLGVNSLSKTIIDQMLSQNRFSAASKITLAGVNYSSGSANSTPVGYTETGRPVYDSSVGMTMNDDLVDAVNKKHAHNTDTMLRGIGTNVIENTSTGNIAAFASQGKYVAFIKEDGSFTGTITLSQIIDLNTLTLDTTRFYLKTEVDSLLSAKVSKASLFNANNKIDSSLLDVDIVRHTDFDPHANNDVIHIKSTERTAWNAKYLKPTTGIPMTDLANDVSSRINSSALNSDLANHTNNSDIHTSTVERAKFNAKYDKPATGIPMTDLSEIVQNNINSSAKATDLQAHKDDVIKHITNEERADWTAKYDKPAGGVPLTDLEAFVQDILNTSASDAELSAHKNDSVAHITNAERLGWNAKYVKPASGVPMTDLESAVQSQINQSATKTELGNHTSNSTVHIADTERTAWNTHKGDAVIHITAGERTAWSAKYDRPSNGIPETDLSAGLQTKLNGMTTSTDFNDHITDSVKHITETERDEWNAKYDKPLAGIPKVDLAESVVAELDGAATQVALNAHIADAIKHVTSLERTTWNGMYTKPSTGIPETDLAQALKDKLASYATATALTTHASDVVKHITVDERTAWNAKYTKPVSGIPEADLDATTKAKIDGSATNADLVAHTGNGTVHVTSTERTAWNGMYTKPSTGIPETDLNATLTSKIDNAVSTTDFNTHATDSTKHVTASERADWNSRYIKPVSGVPMTDLVQAVQDKINGSAPQANLDAHILDNVAHVTSVERTGWNAKYVKPASGIPEVDFVQATQDKLANSVTHIANSTVHITGVERTAWSAKYDKPVDGIPVADLESAVGTGLTASGTHIADSTVHISGAERTAFGAKYDKPADGIPLADLVTDLQNKLSALAVPYTKTVSADATTVSILASEHGITHTNGYEYTVVAYSLNSDTWESVNPSLVRVNQTTKDIEVQFATAFQGKIVVR